MIKFGIYANVAKDVNLTATKMLIEHLKCAKLPICYDEDIAKTLNIKQYEDAENADILFILGGDGTILRAARKYFSKNMSILGINLGRLGFLSEIYVDNIQAAIKSILRESYYIDERMILQGCVKGDTKSHIALNDIVITNKSISRIIGLDLFVNDHKAESYMVDGIIVASPTGSTAYSLSAGGPIISPSVNCLLVTPICPHSLYSRSLVLKSTDTIKIVPHALKNGAQISLDGQEVIDFSSDDIIEIKKSKIKVKFIRFEEKNFFSLLKYKLLQWSTD